MLKQIIMAGYIRESSLFLADSTTIESAAKAVREYGEKKGYIYPLHLEFKEAISAKETAYFQRPRLADMLKAAERGEFQVLVITEVRALSRRGAGEVLIINSELQKYGISLETLSESFSNDDTGELMLGSKAHFAEVELQVIHARMERGKVDRIMIGHAPNGHPKPAYGYRFLDTDRETKAKYVFNHTIVYVDATGKEWSEYDVCLFIFSRALQRISLSSICRQLTEIGIPTPMTGYRKLTPQWRASSLRRILKNPIYSGEVWCNKERFEKTKYVDRLKSEWILLPPDTAPTLITKEEFELIQRYLQWNKEDALRSNKHPKDLGLLRGRFCRCGLCGGSMFVNTPSNPSSKYRPQYMCRGRGHNVTITVSLLDEYAWGCITDVMRHPGQIRARIAELRQELTKPISPAIVAATIADIDAQMANLFSLAQYATNQKTIDSLGIMMQDLEKQKLEADALLMDVVEDDEKRTARENEIQAFEQWAANARVDDPTWVPTYEEKRNAVRALGVIATIFPSSGEYPSRYTVDITVPDIMK